LVEDLEAPDHSSQMAPSRRPAGTQSAVWPDRLIDRLALTLVALQAVLLFWLIRPGYWFVDDLAYLAAARSARLSPGYLRQPFFDHLLPGPRLLNWILIRVAPMDYAVAAALVAVAIAASAWVVYRILRLVFEPTPLMLWLACSAGASAIWLPGLMWWSAGLQLGGSALASTLTCHATVHCYLGPRRTRWGVSAGVWLACGLAFYERALLGGVFAALFVLAVFSARLRPRELLDTARRAGPAFAALLAVGVGYLTVYLLGSYVRQDSRYTVGELIGFLWRSWSHTLVPGLLGGPWRWRVIRDAYSIGWPPGWWVIVGQLAVTGVVVVGVRRLGWRSLRGWLIFVPVFVLAQWLVASARLAAHGVGIGNETRYVADLIPLAVLALAVVLLRPLGDGRPPEQERPERRRAPPAMNRGPERVAAGVLVAGTVAVVLVSALPVSRAWAGNPSRPYLANLRQSAAEADRDGPWGVWNTLVPGRIIDPEFTPYSRVATLAELATGRAVRADDPRVRLLVADTGGNLVPSVFAAAATAPDTCIGPELTRTEPLSRAVDAGRWFLTLDYSAPRASELRFTTGSGTSIVDTAERSQTVTVAGSGRLIVILRPVDLDRIRIDASTAGTCLSRLTIGRPHRTAGH
jgi:hypothetical protein